MNCGKQIIVAIYNYMQVKWHKIWQDIYQLECVTLSVCVCVCVCVQEGGEYHQL